MDRKDVTVACDECPICRAVGKGRADDSRVLSLMVAAIDGLKRAVAQAAS